MEKQGWGIVWRNKAETAAGDLCLFVTLNVLAMQLLCCVKEMLNLILGNVTGGGKGGASIAGEG